MLRYSERPELWDNIRDLSDEVWPEYNVHGETINYYWAQLYDVFPEWQFVLYDPGDQLVLAEGHTIPLAWDGTDEDLGPGIDATLAAAFDPWVRVHTRLGARIGPAIPRSLHITGTVGEWETWTRMAFPETGDYVFPAGLATVHIDRERDLGEYWEPNVWIIHQARR